MDRYQVRFRRIAGAASPTGPLAMGLAISFAIRGATADLRAASVRISFLQDSIGFLESVVLCSYAGVSQDGIRSPIYGFQFEGLTELGELWHGRFGRAAP